MPPCPAAARQAVSVTNREAAPSVRLGIPDLDPLDPCRWRAAAQPIGHRLNRVRRPGQTDLDAPVGAIAHPPRHAKLARPVRRRLAKEYALDAAGEANVPPDPRHHTVEMSGASSAFMPTT